MVYRTAKSPGLQGNNALQTGDKARRTHAAHTASPVWANGLFVVDRCDMHRSGKQQWKKSSGAADGSDIQKREFGHCLDGKKTGKSLLSSSIWEKKFQVFIHYIPSTNHTTSLVS
jgi:hypothetical protein